ncbi:synergin gamma-like isoform X2 [Rana temporaria]|uniref:synergin gamma-like isoform X2 n=1 Tax=Rana temporaria TaxID=8407 RepID=UPI001AAC5061|nr:synergin gamma-like isoform X2 [Rana temporaria]
MAIEPSLLDACTFQLKTCLKNIHKVIQKANEMLCGISQPSVCSEVLMSSRGAEYISGVIEVYRVSKRMEGGMKRFSIDCERLQLAFRDIELAWNNLQAFMSMCPSILQKLPAPSAFDYEAKAMTSDSSLCLQRCCGVCLLERLDQQCLTTSQQRNLRSRSVIQKRQMLCIHAVYTMQLNGVHRV